MELSETEIRVLGVLIEKSLTQAGSYPLTLNAVVLGANQKQNRDPVQEHPEAEIAKALYDLQQRNLVRHAPPAPGARVNRFEHNVVERFHWDRREQAIMAELMLRGRQTAGELRTRASRMAPLHDLEAVSAVLAALATADPPFVEELPREPGRSANRFRHLLSTAPLDLGPSSASAGGEPAVPDTRHADAELAGRVTRLEETVARLADVVESLARNRDSVL